MVMLKAPQLDKKDVIEALYLIFGQDQEGFNTERPRHYHEKVVRSNRGYYVDEETGYFYDEEEEDANYELDDETGYYESPDWTAWDDDWPEDEHFDYDAGYYQENEAILVNGSTLHFQSTPMTRSMRLTWMLARGFLIFVLHVVFYLWWP